MNGLKGAAKKKMKARLMRKQQNCPYCDCVLTKENRTIDHVIPKALLNRGANHKSNLTLCCKKCNNKKGASMVIPARVG